MTARRIGLVIAALLLPVLLLPPAALGARAHVIPGYNIGDNPDREPDELRFLAQPGEANRVEVILVDTLRDSFRVRDAGASITPGEGCSAVDLHTVTCSADFVSVRVGDAADEVDLSRADRGADANGGTGADRLLGTPSYDNLNGGGGGRDVLLGAAGSDRLTDGDRDRRRDADVLDGGESHPARAFDDWVDYGTRREDVRIDLRRGIGGARGERDRITGVGNVVAGGGNDVVVGTSLPNTLQEGHGEYSPAIPQGSLPSSGDDVFVGRGGNDVLVSLGGRDRLTAGSGRDFVACSFPQRLRCTLVGGAGDDFLAASAGPDRLLGGAGADSLLAGRGDDRLDGGPGRDRVRGERGDDVLFARDGARDLVHGGGGVDRARVDAGRDRLKLVEALF